MTFLFVDRITEIKAGQRARGQFAVPAQLAHVPSWLAIEAVGQLAAWVAMAKCDFRRRPVAALAAELKAVGVATSGARLDLAVDIERCDERGIVYGGLAGVDGTPVVELSRCVGPLLPMEEFDDGETVRRHFELLRGPGLPARHIANGVTLPVRILAADRGPDEPLRAELRVPESAPFFADHFPRKPVCPATLLIDAQCRLALTVAAEAMPDAPGDGLRAASVRDLKVRRFVRPGQLLELIAKIGSFRRDGVDVTVSATADGKRVATGCVEVRRNQQS